MIREIFVWLVILAAPVVAQKQDGGRKPPAAPSPPEVKKTVDAITGRWTGQMTARVPGAPAESFDWTMNCRTVASRGCFVHKRRQGFDRPNGRIMPARV